MGYAQITFPRYSAVRVDFWWGLRYNGNIKGIAKFLELIAKNPSIKQRMKLRKTDIKDGNT